MLRLMTLLLSNGCKVLYEDLLIFRISKTTNSIESSEEVVAGELLLGVVEDIVGVALLHDLPVVHEDNVVGDAHSLAQGVGHHDDSVVSLHTCEEVLNLLTGDGVEGTGGLIGEDDLRLHGEAASQAEALLLSTAEYCGSVMEPVLDLVPEPHGGEVALHDAVEMSAVVDAVDTGTIGHIAVDVHGQGAGALGHEADGAAELGEGTTMGLDDVPVA
mgnify:CR=1 FL=1